VETVGRVVARRTDGAGVDLEIEAPDITRHLAVGQSVATDGVCLTVTRHDARRFAVTAVPETLERTALGERTVGTRINLERSLAIGDRLDGHLVQGHVDGVGVVTQIRTMSPGREVSIRMEPPLRRYVARKGSITLDGVSLTVADLETEGFRVALVPHTLRATTLGDWTEGSRVNLEVDVLARYLERLMTGERWSGGEGSNAREG
jgi:riboflavin synthase